MSATDASIQKKNFGSGMTALIISNKEIEDIMEMVKSVEESGLLIKRVSETSGLLRTLLGTLGASILGNMLAGKPKIPGRGAVRGGEGKIRAGQNF